MSGSAVISVENLSFTYKNSAKPALLNINFSVEPGEFILLAGPSGCGKSTLCRVLNGLIPHFYAGNMKGRVTIKGLDTRKTPTHVLARHIGMVFQNPENQLFLSSVEKELAFGPENLGLSKEVIRDRVEKIIELLDLENIRDKPPYELSGGQQQKVAIGAVLTMEPEILVLDEPTANLDPASAEEIMNIICKLNRNLGLTVLLVEHRLDIITPMCTKVFIMMDGRFIAAGKPREILASLSTENVGIDIPKVIMVFKALRNKGITLRNVPLTPEEFAMLVKGRLYELRH